MTCTDCPEEETKFTPLWICPHCNWRTTQDGCNTCINKHLRTHGIDVEIGVDQETEDMLKWYGKKYGKEFLTIDELDTYILLHNLK